MTLEYDLEGLEQALKEGYQLQTSINMPTGLGAILFDGSERLASGNSLLDQGEITPDSNGGINILEAMENAGYDFLEEESPEDRLPDTDAISQFLLENTSHISAEFDDDSGVYVMELGDDLARVTGPNLEQAYEDLQSIAASELTQP